MRTSLKLVNFGYLPQSFHFSVLFLRVAIGLSLLLLHGWGKLISFPTTVESFPDPWSMGRHLSLGLVLFAEVFCAALLVAGIATRFAAAVIMIAMGVALFQIHGADFTAAGTEKALLYLIGCGAIFISGAGRFSADGAGGPVALASLGAVTGGALGYPLSYYFQSAAYKDSTTLGQYITSFREVLTSDETKGIALGVWVGAALLLAVGGLIVGHWMTRGTGRPRETRVVEREQPVPEKLPL